MPKRISDSRLNNLWSKAAKVKYGRCAITGDSENLQSHHIIPKGRQNRFSIRWDIRNAALLRHDVHRRLHDGDLEVQEKLLEYVHERGDFEYLMEIKNMLKHDYLKYIKMTEDEYRYYLLKTLKEIVDKG